MTGTLSGIYIADSAGAPMRSIVRAEFIAGRGIAGDRYVAGAGTFSGTAKKPSQEVTLVEAEEVEAFNATTGRQLRPQDLRRNLITRGIRLNELVGVTFSIGPVLLKGIRLCEPCDYLATLTDRSIVSGLTHRAGLRAAIVAGGVASVGDAVAAINVHPT
jgi:MOSC domain-containing protein YiiM